MQRIFILIKCVYYLFPEALQWGKQGDSDASMLPYTMTQTERELPK